MRVTCLLLGLPAAHALRATVLRPSAGARVNAIRMAEDVVEAAPNLSPAVPEMPSIPEMPSMPEMPSVPGGDGIGAFIDSTFSFIDDEMRVVVAASVLLPLGLFGILLFWDTIKAVIGLATGKEKPVPPEPGPAPKEGGVAEPADPFDAELSAWPAILEIQVRRRGRRSDRLQNPICNLADARGLGARVTAARLPRALAQSSLASLPAEEQRRVKLEAGTNWPPRTTTAAPFSIDREGFMFFQGPTPRTAVQASAGAHSLPDSAMRTAPPPWCSPLLTARRSLGDRSEIARRSLGDRSEIAPDCSAAHDCSPRLFPRHSPATTAASP